MPRSVGFLVVMAELDEVIVAVLGKRLLPRAFVDETFGAAAVQRIVNAGHVGRHHRTEAGPPAATGGHGGIADQNDLDRAAVDDLHGAHALGRQHAALGSTYFFTAGTALPKSTATILPKT